MSHAGHRSDVGDTVKDGRFLDTPDRRRDRHIYHSSSGSGRHDDQYRYHPYRRIVRGYLPKEFKKKKPPTFDGEINKSQDVEAWLLYTKKFFRLQDYSENMKAIVATFSLKGKEDIWWEYVKNVIGIHEEDLTWSDFECLFKKKYVLERYFDDMEKQFYELKMGFMIDDEYTSMFLELLRYLVYLKEEKAKIQRFTSGSPMPFRDRIEFDEPR